MKASNGKADAKQAPGLPNSIVVPAAGVYELVTLEKQMPSQLLGSLTALWCQQGCFKQVTPHLCIQEHHWRPLPSGPPAKMLNTGIILPSAPPSFASTMPARACQSQPDPCECIDPLQPTHIGDIS